MLTLMIEALIHLGIDQLFANEDQLTGSDWLDWFG